MAVAGWFLLTGTVNAQHSRMPNPEDFFPKSPVNNESFAASTEWRQDSTWESHWNTTGNVWQRDRRILRSFNASGRMLSSLNIRWNFSLSEWINVEQYTNTYQADHTTPETTYRHVWDPSLQDWVEEYRAFYNSDADLTEYEERVYDITTGTFTSGEQGFITYSQGAVQELHKSLVTATMTWENMARITTTYDAQENPVTCLVEGWIGGSWMNSQYATMTYTPQGEELEMVVQQWDPVINVWKNVYRISYEYNTSGWLIGTYYSSWDLIFLVWQPVVKILFQYNESGNETLSQSYEWDNTSQLWNPDQKQVSTWYPNNVMHETWRYVWLPIPVKFMEIEYAGYDDNGHEIEQWNKNIDYQTYEYYQGYRTVSSYVDGLLMEALSQSLEVPGFTWVDSWRKTNSWDGNRNLTLELWENWDNIALTWVNSSRDEHFFSSYIGIDEMPRISDICFFSNPLIPGEAIRCPGLSPDASYRVQLISAGGQTVSDQTIRGEETLLLPANLPAGLYILFIAGSNGTTVSGKVTIVN